MRKRHLFCVLGATVLMSSLADANSFDGLGAIMSNTVGPQLKVGGLGYSVVWYDVYNSGSIRVAARLPDGAADTTDCPAGSASLGMPTFPAGYSLLSVSQSVLNWS